MATTWRCSGLILDRGLPHVQYGREWLHELCARNAQPRRVAREHDGMPQVGMMLGNPAAEVELDGLIVEIGMSRYLSYLPDNVGQVRFEQFTGIAIARRYARSSTTPAS